MQKSQQYAPKGQKPIAQGNTLGKSITNTNAPCKGKSVNYQCFCPCRAFCYFQSVHPRRCLGLCAFGAFSPLCLTFGSSLLLQCKRTTFAKQYANSLKVRKVRRYIYNYLATAKSASPNNSYRHKKRFIQHLE